MEENDIQSKDVVFIAHGTTQSTNALLEGDVVGVGILTLGSGCRGSRDKATLRSRKSSCAK
jgi:N-methylhydantoinase A/oxoprolinase/acetone carboxylase beta subunit